MPFIEEVTNNDAKGDRIGVVSWYSREGNKTNYDDDEENLKKAFEAYQKKKEEKAARGKNYENWEERVQKWNTRGNITNRTYFLGQVEVQKALLKLKQSNASFSTHFTLSYLSSQNRRLTTEFMQPSMISERIFAYTMSFKNLFENSSSFHKIPAALFIFSP